MLVKLNKESMIILALIESMFKICLAWLLTITLFQNIDKEVFEYMTEGTPSTIAQYLGFIYLVFIVIRKGVDTWAHYQVSKTKVKDAREKLEQTELETERKRKELE